MTEERGKVQAYLHDERWCEDHRIHYRWRACPLCEEGVEPVRFRLAALDFAGVPLPGTVDLMPGVQYIRYSEVIRRVGRELAAIEKAMLDLSRPLDALRRELYSEMKGTRIDRTALHRAVRAVLRLPGHEAYLEDPTVRSYYEAIENDKVDW